MGGAPWSWSRVWAGGEKAGAGDEEQASRGHTLNARVKSLEVWTEVLALALRCPGARAEGWGRAGPSWLFPTSTWEALLLLVLDLGCPRHIPFEKKEGDP